MPAIRYFKISFVQVYNFFVVLNSYDIVIIDADPEEASGALCAIGCVKFKRFSVTFYAEVPTFRFQHTEEAAFFQRYQHITLLKGAVKKHPQKTKRRCED